MDPGSLVRNPGRCRVAAVLVTLFVAVAATGCTAGSTKKTYVLAEKLWTDGKYAAAVSEFEKVIARDPNGALGLQALHRAATTQAYFLSQYDEAIGKFQRFAEVTSESSESWEAQLQVGEILFSKLENHEQAIQHYRSLLRLRPDAPESPEFLYRIGKSHFFLWQFEDAIMAFSELPRRFPRAKLAERALYEIGVTYFTRGERGASGKSASEPYQQAMEAFQRFIAQYPASSLLPEAKFGIASCLEELDQLDAAYQAYESLKASYPSPNVILIKLHRIKERKAQRSR